MIKTIRIDENNELTLSNTIGWALEYREQFGHDIIPDLLPVLSAIISLMGDFTFIEKNGERKLDVNKLKAIDKDTLQEALINLAGAQFVDFLNLVWAMAKAADDKVKEPKKWVKGFESFPLDVIAPQVFFLLVEGLISSKNLQSLNLAGAEK